MFSYFWHQGSETNSFQDRSPSKFYLSLPTVKACLVATVYYEQLIEQTTLAFVTL